MKTTLVKLQVLEEPRRSEEIDVSKEPDLYFALLAYEYHGDAIRDNAIGEWVEIGMEIERNGE